MYGGAQHPPWPPSLVDLFASPASLCPILVQPALSSPKCPGITGLRYCSIGRCARVWTGIAVQMHYVLHVTRARVIRVYYLHKICALRNNASLLRMLRDVGDYPVLGLAGLRLLATGKTGTPPDRLHPLAALRVAPSYIRPHLDNRITSATGLVGHCSAPRPPGVYQQGTKGTVWEPNHRIAMGILKGRAIDLFSFGQNSQLFYQRRFADCPIAHNYWAHTHTQTS